MDDGRENVKEGVRGDVGRNRSSGRDGEEQSSRIDGRAVLGLMQRASNVKGIGIRGKSPY